MLHNIILKAAQVFPVFGSPAKNPYPVFGIKPSINQGMSGISIVNMLAPE